MKFPYKQPSKYHVGETKSRRAFAWWPRLCRVPMHPTKLVWVWLESYEQLWTFTECVSSMYAYIPPPPSAMTQKEYRWLLTHCFAIGHVGVPHMRHQPPPPKRENSPHDAR